MATGQQSSSSYVITLCIKLFRPDVSYSLCACSIFNSASFIFDAQQILTRELGAAEVCALSLQRLSEVHTV